MTEVEAEAKAEAGHEIDEDADVVIMTTPPKPQVITLHKPRKFPAPRLVAAASPLLGPTPTMEQVDFLLSSGAGTPEVRMWADRLWSGHKAETLGKLSGDDRLPWGMVQTDPTHTYDVVVGLRSVEGDTWCGQWGVPIVGEPMQLDPDEIVAYIDAVESGAKGLILSAVRPQAFLGAAPAATKMAPTELPEGARIFAVVDDLDRDAIIELYAIAAGGKIWRRHAGGWYVDPGVATVLRSLKPPPTRVVPEELIASVLRQVDESTKEDEYEETDPKKFHASALLPAAADIHAHESEIVVERALLAASKYGRGMPAKLQRYWLFGEGAAKVRWGTPGAWRRCFRQLSKYMSPGKAKGACTNLSQKLGGHGVATHVGV